MVHFDKIGGEFKILMTDPDGFEYLCKGHLDTFSSNVERHEITSLGDNVHRYITGGVTHTAVFTFTSMEYVSKDEPSLTKIPPEERLLRKIDS